MKDLKSQFIDWLETKPEDEEYDFWDGDRCALMQFGDERFGDTSFAMYVRLSNGGVGIAASEKPRTFGALRSRLMAQS